jgi:hypothetical protein
MVTTIPPLTIMSTSCRACEKPFALTSAIAAVKQISCRKTAPAFLSDLSVPLAYLAVKSFSLVTVSTFPKS